MALIDANGNYNPKGPIRTAPPVGGSGSPEGVYAGGPHAIYFDETNSKLYVKPASTGYGTTGWIEALTVV